MERNQNIAYEILTLMCDSTWACDLKEYVSAVQEELKDKFTPQQVSDVMDLNVICSLLKPKREEHFMLRGKIVERKSKLTFQSGNALFLSEQKESTSVLQEAGRQVVPEEVPQVVQEAVQEQLPEVQQVVQEEVQEVVPEVQQVVSFFDQKEGDVVGYKEKGLSDDDKIMEVFLLRLRDKSIEIDNMDASFLSGNMIVKNSNIPLTSVGGRFSKRNNAWVFSKAELLAEYKN